MRILVHDYSGHPFQVQLSRHLAQRGHDVTHLYSASIQSPRGALELKPSDPEGFSIEGISLGEEVKKYSLLKRRNQERKYGSILYKIAEQIRPDFIIASNTPPDAFLGIMKAKAKLGIPYIYWLQDLYSEAIRKYINIPFVRLAAYLYYGSLERKMALGSARVVLISEDFKIYLKNWKLPESKYSVIENWAPLEEISPTDKSNSWSKNLSLNETFNFVYSGTLGLKHNPDLLIKLAKEFESEDEVRIVVVSSGAGANWLDAQIRNHGIKNIVLLGFQPYDQLPLVLGTADVLITLLERSAAELSVPSKVLSNFCAAKPQLLAVPNENLASRTVKRNGSGLCVSPEDSDGFLSSARMLYESPEVRLEMGRNARDYANKTFDIDTICSKFISLISGHV